MKLKPKRGAPIGNRRAAKDVTKVRHCVRLAPAQVEFVIALGRRDGGGRGDFTRGIERLVSAAQAQTQR